MWLVEMGANVIGYSLPQPPTSPCNYELSRVGQHITDIRGDIRDYEKLRQTIKTYQPQLIFHLAAQPIVLRSVKEPKLTFDTNAGGTVNILESIRTTDCVKALVSITTDKVYSNQEWLWGYRENDTLGGHDPYSASKGMAELAIASYRQTFFSDPKQRQVSIASVRAGNVIGGGDFAPYRLVPDCMRALLAKETIIIRNPESIRPWQLVLEPLSGYLLLAAMLLQEGQRFAQAWNFGPLEQIGISAQAVVEKIILLWKDGSWMHDEIDLPQIETGQLRLNWDKAASLLDWRPIYKLDEALSTIVDWYKAYESNHDMYDFCVQQIHSYTEQARVQGMKWA